MIGGGSDFRLTIITRAILIVAIVPDRNTDILHAIATQAELLRRVLEPIWMNSYFARLKCIVWNSASALTCKVINAGIPIVGDT